jgi:hypothetical protein
MKTPAEAQQSPSGELSQLVDRIQHLKQEHEPLVSKISGDAGMSVELRRELLAHLNEEEAEIITKMAAISPQVASRYRPTAMAGARVSMPLKPHEPQAAPPAPSRGLTVGSLRDDPGAGAADLRSAQPASIAPRSAAAAPRPAARARLSIGSLRSR